MRWGSTGSDTGSDERKKGRARGRKGGSRGWWWSGGQVKACEEEERKWSVQLEPEESG